MTIVERPLSEKLIRILYKSEHSQHLWFQGPGSHRKMIFQPPNKSIKILELLTNLEINLSNQLSKFLIATLNQIWTFNSLTTCTNYWTYQPFYFGKMLWCCYPQYGGQADFENIWTYASKHYKKWMPPPKRSAPARYEGENKAELRHSSLKSEVASATKVAVRNSIKVNNQIETLKILNPPQWAGIACV